MIPKSFKDVSVFTVLMIRVYPGSWVQLKSRSGMDASSSRAPGARVLEADLGWVHQGKNLSYPLFALPGNPGSILLCVPPCWRGYRRELNVHAERPCDACPWDELARLTMRLGPERDD